MDLEIRMHKYYQQLKFRCLKAGNVCITDSTYNLTTKPFISTALSINVTDLEAGHHFHIWNMEVGILNHEY